MIPFAALVGLAVLFAAASHDRLKVGLAALAVVLVMGGPVQFIHAALAAIPGI